MSILLVGLMGFCPPHGEAQRPRPFVPGQAAADSPNNPHIPPAPGPWFEGWYTRVSDVDGARSIAVICASHLPAGQVYDPEARLPGYVNVLVSEGDGAPTHSFVVFPERTWRTVRGEPVSEFADLGAPSDFTWHAEGFGTVTEDSIDLNLPGMITVSIRTGTPRPWNPRFPELGPEGALAFLPLPLHWHISSLGSEAWYRYRMDSDGILREGQGYAHQEKNWQDEFPLGWVWIQGIDRNNEAQIVGSIADVNLTPTFRFQPWIVGYRSPRANWTFRFSNPSMKIETAMHPRWGLALMRVEDASRELNIFAWAPPGTYGAVAVPTPEGFVADRGGESFSAWIRADVYARDGNRRERIERRVFRNAVLEFGGRMAETMHPPPTAIYAP